MKGMGVCHTRRNFLLANGASALAARAEIGKLFRPERVRYPDPATEFEVFRLTDPVHSCFMPPTAARIFARGGAQLLHVSDRDGTLQAYVLDIKSGESRQVTQAAALDPQSMTLAADDRSVLYLDSGALWNAPLSGAARPRQVYKLSAPSVAGVGLNAIPDGPAALVVDGDTRLLMVNLVRGTTQTVASAKEPIREPMPRPRRASLLYRTNDGGIWLAHLNGQRNVRLKTIDGQTGAARWSRDGRTVLYLSVPAGSKTQSLRELDPDTGEERRLADTTQFVQFSANSDASVFVGASGSKASPYVFLLIRAAARELTICEHRSTDPSQTRPVFSPDSQRIFFQSDRHGKLALYSMNIEKLVEKTVDEIG